MPPISLPINIRGGLICPEAMSRAAEQCAIICATSIFPHCLGELACNLSMREITSSAASGSNRFFIITGPCGKIITKSSTDGSSECTIGRLCDDPHRQSRESQSPRLRRNRYPPPFLHEPCAFPDEPFGAYQLHRSQQSFHCCAAH